MVTQGSSNNADTIKAITDAANGALRKFSDNSSNPSWCMIFANTHTHMFILSHFSIACTDENIDFHHISAYI